MVPLLPALSPVIVRSSGGVCNEIALDREMMVTCQKVAFYRPKHNRLVLSEHLLLQIQRPSISLSAHLESFYAAFAPCLSSI
jgi:hypothetical protein